MSNLFFPSCRRLLGFLTAAALAALPALGDEPLAKLREEVAAHPSQAPGAVIRLIRSPESAAKPRWAARVTVAALQGLGPDSSGARQTTAIVFAAVRAAPDHVLEIVHAATLASPKEQAPNIAAAAVAATPHPFRRIMYHRDSTPLSEYGTGPDGRVVGRDVTDDKSDKKAVAPDEIAEQPMALAQAVVQEAEGSWAVLAAVDATLVGSPDYLLGAMTNASMLAAIGDLGLSNFGNEPLHPVLGPQVPPLPPVSPPVSF